MIDARPDEALAGTAPGHRLRVDPGHLVSTQDKATQHKSTQQKRCPSVRHPATVTPTAAMPTTGAASLTPPIDPENRASPNANTPPSAPTSQ